MISVLLEVGDDDVEGFGLTLACLVPAALDGLVREVVVLDAGLGPSVRRLAEEGGCTIRPSLELSDAVAGARGDLILLLEAGAELQPGWIEATRRWTRRPSPGGARYRPATRRLADLFVLGRTQRLSRGVLASRQLFGRQFRIGMGLALLAATVPTEPLNARIATSRDFRRARSG